MLFLPLFIYAYSENTQQLFCKWLTTLLVPELTSDRVNIAGGELFEKKEMQYLIWYILAAKLKNDKAQFHLGNLYQTGESYPKNMQQALYWYTEAVKKKHSATMLKRLYPLFVGDLQAEEKVLDRMQRLYFMEREVLQNILNIEKKLDFNRLLDSRHSKRIQNWERSVYWYLYIVRGFPFAGLRLAELMYQQKHFMEAYIWYNIASAEGQVSSKLHDKIVKQLSDDLLIVARRKALQWRVIQSDDRETRTQFLNTLRITGEQRAEVQLAFLSQQVLWNNYPAEDFLKELYAQNRLVEVYSWCTYLLISGEVASEICKINHLEKMSEEQLADAKLAYLKLMSLRGYASSQLQLAEALEQQNNFEEAYMWYTFASFKLPHARELQDKLVKNMRVQQMKNAWLMQECWFMMDNILYRAGLRNLSFPNLND